MGGSGKFFGKLVSAAGLPDEPVPGLPLVGIIEDCRVLIENHHGVSEYGPKRIRVKVKFGCICVCGCNLELSRMTRGQLIISGNIESVQLYRG